MPVTRRDFVKNVSLASAGIGLLHPFGLKAKENAAGKLKLGFIGVGLRGQSHLQMCLGRNDVEVSVICDTD